MKLGFTDTQLIVALIALCAGLGVYAWLHGKDIK